MNGKKAKLLRRLANTIAKDDDTLYEVEGTKRIRNSTTGSRFTLTMARSLASPTSTLKRLKRGMIKIA